MANAISSLSYDGNTYPFTLPYGVCGTAADTAAKTVTVPNFSLETGATVIVKFTYANSIASPTLNVNSTGAKPIMRYGTTAASTGTTTTGWVAGAIQMFTYDGTNWVRDYWSNTTYSNVSLGQGYCTCSTAAATVAKTASLSSYSLTTGGIVAVKFTYDVPASATLNINSKGAKSIYYNGAAITAGIIKAGDTATFIYSSQYHLIGINRDLDVTHPSATATTGVPTANATPAFGGTFSVNQIINDANGHVTANTSRTVTIPSTLSNGTGTAGLIKTSSTVTSNSGYTACPVISGVPYYKDTNTTYTSLKNPNALTVKGNGTQSFTYDGSAAKTLNIKAGTNVSVSSDTSGNITINSSMPSHQHTGLVKGDYTAILSDNGNFRLDEVTTAADTGTIGTTDIPWRAGYFSEGVYSKGNRIPDFAYGNQAATSVAALSYTDVTITFPFAFSAAPSVSLTLVSTSTAGAIGEMSAAVYSISTTNCVVRLFNGGSSARTPGFHWIASGTKA